MLIFLRARNMRFLAAYTYYVATSNSNTVLLTYRLRNDEYICHKRKGGDFVENKLFEPIIDLIWEAEDSIDDDNIQITASTPNTHCMSVGCMMPLCGWPLNLVNSYFCPISGFSC